MLVSEEDIELGIEHRAFAWIAYCLSLSFVSGLTGFFIWCLRFDFELAKEDVINSTVENMGQSVSAEVNGSEVISGFTIVAKYIRILGKCAYFKTAITLWTICNVVIYVVTTYMYRIYLGSVLYTLLSVAISKAIVSAGIFVLAMVRRDLTPLLEYEAKPLVDLMKVFGINLDDEGEVMGLGVKDPVLV